MRDYEELLLAKVVEIGGMHVLLNSLPPGLILRNDLGILSTDALNGKIVHRVENSSVKVLETRATVTPNGDYLLIFPEGEHYGSSEEKVNTMLAYRSKDKGKTWAGPTIAFDIDYNQHGFIPFIPRGTKRIYAFGTQPIPGRYTRANGLHENAPIGYRYSDDDGYTWSEVKLIEPFNDPSFTGMSVMRMCETENSTWLIGAHESDFSYRPLMTRQYLLRSVDKGETWEVLPAKRHGGWYVSGYNRMDEGRPINLGKGRVLLMVRTPEGHLWSLWSYDDGKTWIDPKPTQLIHPDAPPMVFHLYNEEVLIAFYHNRFSDSHYSGLSGGKEEIMRDRSEIWFSISTDFGETWSDPRFLFANALYPNLDNPWKNYQCSYMDMFVDEEVINLFVPHRWQQVLHLNFKISELLNFPTRNKLRRILEL